MRKTKTIFPYILLSIVAAALTLIMILAKSSNKITFEDRIIVTGTLITSCLFGISIAVYPNWWKRFIRQADRTSSLQSEKTIKSFRGHHPDCNMFKSHIILIKNKPRCAGCLGLIFGSIISILLIVIFLFILPRLSLTTLYFVFALGLILLPFVYAEIIYPKRYACTHTIFNIVLVFGFFCLTISIFEITGDLIYGILTIILCFLWLDTRIQLSNWNHIRMCNSCPESCKMYEA